MESLLEIEDLNLTLQGKTIFKNISFSLEKGSFTVICGRNGAGKSQLMRTIKGLQKQTSGKIIIKGEDVSKKKARRLSLIALVFQDADVQAVGETVEKDIEFGPENLELSREEVIRRREEVISLLHLEKQRNQRPSTLSGGEKRKLAIAGVLAMKPEVILLDEPFANLDYPSTLILLKTLKQLHESGHTIVVVSHEVEKFLALTDKVIILKDGCITYNGDSSASINALKEADVYVPSLPFKELSWLMA